MKYSIFHLDWSKRKVYESVHVIEGFTCPRLTDWNISGQHNNHGITNWLKIISRERCFFFNHCHKHSSKKKLWVPMRNLEFLRLRSFSLSHAHEKTKKHLSLLLYWAQNLPSLLFYEQVFFLFCFVFFHF